LGQWEDAHSEEEEDYYKKNAISKLDPNKAKEFEKLDKECKALSEEEYRRKMNEGSD
jgi:hypothetical protein